MASRANVNDYLLGSKLYIGRTKSNEVRKSFCSGRLSLGFPLEFRYISVLPPMILRYFFDHSSIDLRSPNGEWTENERRMNEGWTRIDWESNENRTRTEREPNENRTKDDTENIPSELLVGLLYSFIVNDFSGVNKSRFWDVSFWWRPHNTLQEPSAYKYFTAEYRTLSDVLFENHFVAYTHNSLFESCHCHKNLR
mgnify:CR=1 FL=1